MYKVVRSLLKKNVALHYHPVVLRYVGDSTVLNEDLTTRLETVSLVGFSKHNGFEVLSASVNFADRITRIDTTGVLPLVTVLETWDLNLRKDQPSDKITRRDIMRNALVVEEDYFVAPVNQKV